MKAMDHVLICLMLTQLYGKEFNRFQQGLAPSMYSCNYCGRVRSPYVFIGSLRCLFIKAVTPLPVATDQASRAPFQSLLLIIKNRKRDVIHWVENRASEVSLKKLVRLASRKKPKTCCLQCCECFRYLYNPTNEGCGFFFLKVLILYAYSWLLRGGHIPQRLKLSVDKFTEDYSIQDY